MCKIWNWNLKEKNELDRKWYNEILLEFLWNLFSIFAEEMTQFLKLFPVVNLKQKITFLRHQIYFILFLASYYKMCVFNYFVNFSLFKCNIVLATVMLFLINLKRLRSFWACVILISFLYCKYCRTKWFSVCSLKFKLNICTNNNPNRILSKKIINQKIFINNELKQLLTNDTHITYTR